MEKFITAMFDSEDEADFARTRLNRQGVRYSRCETFNASAETGDDLRLVVNPYNPIFSNNIGENWGSLAGANMQKYGGFLYIHDKGEHGAASASVVGYDSGMGRHSGEVLMRILVDERDCELARAALVSCHATHVRES